MASQRWYIFCGYQEGDVMLKTEDVNSTELAKALRKNGIVYKVIDITGECYELLKKKREAAISLQEDFPPVRLDFSK